MLLYSASIVCHQFAPIHYVNLLGGAEVNGQGTRGHLLRVSVPTFLLCPSSGWQALYPKHISSFKNLLPECNEFSFLIFLAAYGSYYNPNICHWKKIVYKRQ